jgi:hypothetical protein
MKAFQVSKHAHPNQIQTYALVKGIRNELMSRSNDVPVPTPKEGQVLVDVYASALNFFEYVTPYHYVHMSDTYRQVSCKLRENIKVSFRYWDIR